MLCFEMVSVWRRTYVQTSGHCGECVRTGVANLSARNCFHLYKFVLTHSLTDHLQKPSTPIVSSGIYRTVGLFSIIFLNIVLLICSGSVFFRFFCVYCM